MSLLEAIKVSKVYEDAASPVEVLRDLDFVLREGEMAGIFGASGSGKSTLLHILGALDWPTSGEVRADGEELCRMGPEEIARFRNRSLGFVFQFYHLLSEFTAAENVMLPALIAGKGKREALKLALEALDVVGLSARAAHRPAMLSGGEQQRVAIARATVMNPPLILADEP
ncbi:MAG TPA: ABC transporter ATP-binding protein, partial [bacterium]|nr:ABC transporter ATP-binding protein [bacterium]